MVFDQQKKFLQISPSDISTSVWSWDDFYKRCVLKEWQEPNPEMLWGSFCHSYTELTPDEREGKNFPIEPKFLQTLHAVKEDTKDYLCEQAFQRDIKVDDWNVKISYRLDRLHPTTGKVIELKFPTRPWENVYNKVNGDIKNLCYKLFHPHVELWCITLSNGIETYPVKKSQTDCERIVKEQLLTIIGRLQLNYF